MLKNHRREQSANATAGRQTKDPNGWGDVRDDRRTESYERPAIDEEYEIVASKAQRYKEEEKRVNSQQQPKQDLRISYMSPSPD